MDPKVFIGQPVYLAAHPQAVLGATAYASEVPGRTVYRCMESPFHCGNFNALWCTALNSRKEFGWTHFAMIHQDVQPERWWVDRLISLMSEHGVSLLGVVLPLKDDHGLTSTAVLNKDTLTTRRLSMKEIHQYLPPTFRTRDLKALGHKNSLLLHGSGLWICDFTQPWVEHVWFECPAKILALANGTFASAVWDEGWNFSLQLYQQGLKIACTRQVLANHLGGGVWGNEEPWGEWETDGGDTSQSWILGKTDEPASNLH
jgi:hypothetical protein